MTKLASEMHKAPQIFSTIFREGVKKLGKGGEGHNSQSHSILLQIRNPGTWEPLELTALVVGKETCAPTTTPTLTTPANILTATPPWNCIPKLGVLISTNSIIWPNVYFKTVFPWQYNYWGVLSQSLDVCCQLWSVAVINLKQLAAVIAPSSSTLLQQSHFPRLSLRVGIITQASL